MVVKNRVKSLNTGLGRKVYDVGTFVLLLGYNNESICSAPGTNLQYLESLEPLEEGPGVLLGLVCRSGKDLW
jgi:hypothetical protein